MSQRQEAVADRLVSIIQSIQLGRSTGVLKARRGVGKAQEEGTIIFANGQVTQAKVGRRAGSEALNWLSTWGTCHYTFTATNTDVRPHVLPATPAPEPLSLIPYQTRQLESALRMIEHMGLSRTHRRLFLLIDGQRTVQDLARLMGRSQSDVSQLLRDLEHATVIRMTQR